MVMVMVMMAMVTHFLDNKSSNALRSSINVSLSINNENIGIRTVGNPHLVSVHNCSDADGDDGGDGDGDGIP